MLSTKTFLHALCLLAGIGVTQTLTAQTLNYLSTNSQSAGARSEFYGGTASANPVDVWNGVYDLAVTGTYSGSSSLPSPGLGSSASSSFLADLTYSPSNWNLVGTASASISTGTGNSGSAFPTIASASGSGASITFSVDSPFALSLQSSLSNQFVGNDPSIVVSNQATTRLFAVALDGVFTNQYLVDWNTLLGSSGGTFDGSWNSGVFRLEFGAGPFLSSNNPGSFGTTSSSYDIQLSVSHIPEPSGELLALLGGGWFLGLRRRRL